MSYLDWLIVAVPLAGIIYLALHSRKYVRGVADFLVAGRVAGRYVMSIGDLSASMSVITLVAICEQNYQTGFGIGFWNNIIMPVSLVLALTGYCTYRWRQTRCLSKGQFIELRYGSKGFRIVTAVISNMSEMIANAIGPAIATKFFIYYLGLPHKVMIAGVPLPCYGIIVVLCLALSAVLILPGGRVSLLITDCIQGILCYPIFAIFTFFILLKFGWDVDIMPILLGRVPEQSFIDPYDIDQLRDFNLFALVVTLSTTIINRASWIGNDTTGAGRTPHEQKIAGILGTWRSGFSVVIMLLLGVTVYVFMNSGHFSRHDEHNGFKVTNNEVRQELSDRVLSETISDQARYAKIIGAVKALPDITYTPGVDAPLSQQQNLDTRYFDTVQQELGDTPTARKEFQNFRSTYSQMMMPTLFKNILPMGLLGLFCLLMIMLLISTDASRIFNASGGIVQDIILPFYRGHLTPEKHLLLLRGTSVGVICVFLCVSLLFAQMDYIVMFTTIMCALWLGGAGPIMVFGLYTRWGNLTGAWCSIIFGSGTSLLGMLCQYNWAETIYPYLESMNFVHFVDNFLVTVSAPFDPYVKWQMNPVKFPINSYEIFFIAMVLAISGYVIGSLLTYKPYNLDKLLHRGKYADGESLVQPKMRWTLSAVIQKLVGIDSEYTLGDKILAWSVFGYSFVFIIGGTFLGVIIWNAFDPWPIEYWSRYFFVVSLVLPCIIGVISTVWFTIGGLVDTRRLLRDLKIRVENQEDNGQVISSGKE
ncbi:MAG: hypothetical protein LBM70_05940 [Victivallales bacterium]|jgi:Na+/proline symporter|nr:hypothetical protein [Victivallales bacterium]